MNYYCLADMDTLTRKQHEIIGFLLQNLHDFNRPPSLAELCTALGLKSRGSLHRHIQGLIEAKLIENIDHKHRGIRLTEKAKFAAQKIIVTPNSVRYVGVIAAGKPIEAVEDVQYMMIPDELKSDKPCYILKVKGDSMIEKGIYDGDWVIIEQRSSAHNGEIVVALVDEHDVTLKCIEQTPDEILLIPANADMQTLHYHPSQVQIQGVLVGQMRSYRQ